MEITVKGIKLSYTDAGSGEEVLMLHGWGSSKQVYNGFINTLKENHRCVALDFPGCGESQIMESPFTLEDYAQLVKEFIAAVGLKNPVLVGHSHGGRVVLYMAAKRILNPPKIVLLDSAGIVPEKTASQRAKTAMFKVAKSVLGLRVFGKMGEEMVEKARSRFGSADYKAAPRVLRETLVNVVNVDLRDILHNIKCPTLLIWGDRDAATPLSDAEIIKSKIPDSGLCIIKGTGHFSFCENPVQANAIIKSFLG